MDLRQSLIPLYLAGSLSLLGQLPRANLIGFYSFNGTASDSSGRGNDGTIHGSPTFTANAPFGGSAITFAGDDSGHKNDYITVPIDTAIEDTQQETFGGWFLVSSGASTCCIRGLISSDDGGFDPTLGIDTRNGSFQFTAFTGGNLAGIGTANNGQWTFVAVSYNNLTQTYILQVGNTQIAGTTYFDNGSLEGRTYIGINPNFDFEFNGEIADVFFYNTALSAWQLNAIAQGGPSAILAIPNNQTTSLLLGSSGTREQLRQGSGTSQPQSVSILAVGAPATLNWKADVLNHSELVTLSSATGTASPGNPGTLTLVPTGAVTNLAPGGYYVLVRVTNVQAPDAPLYFTLVFDVSSSTNPAVPSLSTGGMYFTSTTPPQTLVIYTSNTSPLPFQTSVSTSDGAPWLTASPASGSASTQSPGKITVSVTAPTTPGIYYGSVSVTINNTQRTLNVTLVDVATLAHTAVAHAATVCTASQLAITETGLASNFSVPAGWPATLIVQLNDDCGNAVTNGSVVASFSNGDPPLRLLGDQSSNNYAATWQPGGVQSQMSISIRATGEGLPAAVRQFTGGVNPNAFPAPTLVPNGVLHIFFDSSMAAVLGGGLAPGNVAQIYGTGLSSATSQTVVPLPPEFNGTTVLIGAMEAPLFFVSDTHVNVQVPFELTPNRSYSVIVSANGALTLPETIDVVALQPGVAQFPDGTVIAQISGTTTLISSSNPAKPGQSLTIYLAGMGATNPPVGSGQPTPLQLVSADVPPIVTLNGQPVNVTYAGLTPASVGLYQINFTVPTNAQSGSLDLAVSQNGIPANTTKLPVSN